MFLLKSYHGGGPARATSLCFINSVPIGYGWIKIPVNPDPAPRVSLRYSYFFEYSSELIAHGRLSSVIKYSALDFPPRIVASLEPGNSTFVSGHDCFLTKRDRRRGTYRERERENKREKRNREKEGSTISKIIAAPRSEFFGRLRKFWSEVGRRGVIRDDAMRDSRKRISHVARRSDVSPRSHARII